MEVAVLDVLKCYGLLRWEAGWMPSHIASMSVSTGGTFQTKKPFDSLKDQALQIAGLDGVLQEIARTNLLEQTKTEISIGKEKSIPCVDPSQKCSAEEALPSEGDCRLDEECISSYGIRKGVRYLAATDGVGLSPSIATVNYRDASVEFIAVDSCLPSREPLASSVRHDSGFDHGVMDGKEDVDCRGPLRSASFVCSNSLVAVHKKSSGTVLNDSGNLAEMNCEHARNKEGADISEGHCRQALAFDHCTIEGKDRFQFAALTKSTDIAGQDSPISAQKLLRVASGRNLVDMTPQPSGSGKVIGVTDLFGKQPLTIDQDSVYAKDASHSPGPSMSTNESPISVQKTLKAKDTSETCNCLVGMDSLPTSSGKVADVRELNSTLEKSSCRVDTEDITSKSWHLNKATGASVAGLGTCISVKTETGRESLVCENGNAHEIYSFHRPAFNPQGVTEGAIGKGFLPSTLGKPEKPASQEPNGGRREHVFHKVCSGSDPGDQGNNKGRLSKQELQKSGLSADDGIHLIDILEGLVSLDENGFFSNPLEDSFGPDHLKIPRKPICFSYMRHKIHSKDYKTWRSFVDDFEDICRCGMNYKERGSSIWNAAHTLLYRGRKYLEQFADRAEMCFGLPNETKEGKSTCYLEAFSNGHRKVGNMLYQDAECSFSKKKREINKAVLPVKYNNLPDQKLVNLLRTADTSGLPEDESLQYVCGPTLPCTQNMVYVEELEENRSNTETIFDNMSEANLQVQTDESMVEILKCTGDEIRFNPVEQATECSSSFGDTEFDSDNDGPGSGGMCDASEVESELRNGNGAATSAEVDASGLMKRKKALTPEWKDYRHHIEWRCQWLELRIRELLCRASKYDHLLEDIQARKPWKDEQQAVKAFTARSSPLIDKVHRHRILHRRRRKKVENVVELSLDISHHPLFSLYEKKKRLEADGVSIDDDSNSMKITGTVSNDRLEENDFKDHLTGTDSKDGEKSVEQLLWQIETLQSRMLKMKNQLSRYKSRKAVKYSARNISNNFLKAKASKGVFQAPVFSPVDSMNVETPIEGGSNLQMEPNLSCQRNSKFYSSDLVMSCNGTSSFVEPAQHDFNEYPKCQLFDTDMILDQPEREDSSDEVTNEEVYKEHTAVMGVKEKQQQDFPSPVKRLTEAESIVGKGASQSQTTGATEKDVSPAAVGESISNRIHLPFDLHVPRCKRKKPHSRSSSFQRVEVLHTSPAEEQNNPLEQDNDVNELKMESKTSPVSDGNGDSV